MIKERSNVIDIVKTIAIFMVVLGHSIQYGSGYSFINNQYFFDNIIFKIIYTFHMPLFVLISGYLLYGGIKKYNYKELITKKIKSLLVPIISFSFIQLIINIIQGQKITLHRLISTFTFNLWFLWAVLIMSLIVILNNKFFKDNVIVYLIILALSLITPTIYNLHLYAYVYPFFILGYLYKKNEDKFKITKKALIYCELFLILIYIILFKQYSYDSYIYTSGMSIINNINQLYIDVYRFVIGLVGSVICIILIKLIHEKELKQKFFYLISKNTLGIYAISNLLFLILEKITYDLKDINYFYTLVECISIIAICMIIIILFEKINILSILFLGKNKEK